MTVARLVALSASYLLRRPRLAGPSLRVAFEIGMRVRRAPIKRADPTLLGGELIPICSLVSDTHVTAPGTPPCELAEDPGQWPWRNQPTSEDLVAGIRRVLAAIACDAPRTVIWCGDEVDTGDAAEWAAWRDAIVSVPAVAHRLVPGNHDICFNRPFDEDYDLARRARREHAYQEHAGRLADFPIVDTILGDAGPATVVLLDSCRFRSTHVLSNAVGYFGDIQLQELARVLDTVRGPVLCVSHHHVWRDAAFMHPEGWYNTAIDADVLTEILVRYRRRARGNHVLVCHGHRHSLTAGWIGDVDAPIAVVGLPSTTLGDKAHTGVLDGIVRYAVAGLRADGSWGVTVHELGKLIDAGEPIVCAPAIRPNAALRELAVVRRG